MCRVCDANVTALRWIPFAENGGGDHYVLDLAESFGGQVGLLRLFLAF
jgi:cell wall assembly regulator SMI1